MKKLKIYWSDITKIIIGFIICYLIINFILRLSLYIYDYSHSSELLTYSPILAIPFSILFLLNTIWAKKRNNKLLFLIAPIILFVMVAIILMVAYKSFPKYALPEP